MAIQLAYRTAITRYTMSFLCQGQCKVYRQKVQTSALCCVTICIKMYDVSICQYLKQTRKASALGITYIVQEIMQYMTFPYFFKVFSISFLLVIVFFCCLFSLLFYTASCLLNEYTYRQAARLPSTAIVFVQTHNAQVKTIVITS